eukprot:COSAG02_NODE_5156_length_4583_cov_2.229706_4_plen_165_part_00
MSEGVPPLDSATQSAEPGAPAPAPASVKFSPRVTTNDSADTSLLELVLEQQRQAQQRREKVLISEERLETLQSRIEELHASKLLTEDSKGASKVAHDVLMFLTATVLRAQTRKPKQCRERFFDFTDPAIDHISWRREAGTRLCSRGMTSRVVGSIQRRNCGACF